MVFYNFLLRFKLFKKEIKFFPGGHPFLIERLLGFRNSIRWSLVRTCRKNESGILANEELTYFTATAEKAILRRGVQVPEALGCCLHCVAACIVLLR